MDYKIYVKKIEEQGEFLELTLCIFDNNEPEFTTKLVDVSQDDGTIKQEEVEVPRKEIVKKLRIQINVVNDFVEREVVKELEKYKLSLQDKDSKINYFKNKVF
mgnify:CR=1 FL=1